MAGNLTVTGVSPNSGSLKGGNTVTITGTGFSSKPQQVLFGKTAAADVQLLSDTAITATAPAVGTPETVDVTVYLGPDISLVTPNSRYTYALPFVSSVSPASGPVNGGDSITMAGQYFTGASYVQFGDTGATPFTVNSDTEITTVSPAGADINDVVDVRITVQGKLSEIVPQDKFTYTEPQPLTISFTKDENNNVPDGQILIGFFDGKAPAVPADQPVPDITYAVPNATFNITNNLGNTPILPVQLSPNFNTGGWVGGYGYPFAGNWYTLSELSEGVSVLHFSGRVYVVYAASPSKATGWAFPQISQGGWGYTPNPVDDKSKDFSLRFDQMELTYNGNPNDVGDLTSINFWAIPMTLTTSLKGTTVASVTGEYNGATANSIFTALSALTNGDAVVPAGFSLTGPSGQAPFVRIIGPASYAVNGLSSPYNNFSGYLTYVQQQSGVNSFANISGRFGGSPQPKGLPPEPFAAQAYNLKATMNSAGDIILTGTVGDEQNVTVTFAYSDIIAPPGLYGADLPCTISPAPYPKYPPVPGNDVYGWLVADLYLGFNIGAICSPAVGSQPSSTWYTLAQVFEQLQSNSNYYNQWAASMQHMSQAYNFAYSDRLKAFHYLISLAPGAVDTLNVALSDLVLPNP